MSYTRVTAGRVPRMLLLQWQSCRRLNVLQAANATTWVVAYMHGRVEVLKRGKDATLAKDLDVYGISSSSSRSRSVLTASALTLYPAERR